MPIKRFDKTEQLAVGVGTAALTFTTATTGNRTYAAAGAEEGDQFWARIQHETLPAEWEICLATIVGGTITRATPVQSSTGAAVSFSAGNKIVSDGVPFIRIPTADGDDDIDEPDIAAQDYLKVWSASLQRWMNLRYEQIANALTTPKDITEDYTAVAGNRLRPDTTAAAITVTLPADPAAGDEVWFEAPNDSWETNSLTVDPGDEEIDGFDEPVEFTVPDDFVFRFSGTSWRLI